MTQTRFQRGLTHIMRILATSGPLPPIDDPAPAPEPAKDVLWAVWPYDTFPYYLCAQVETFNPDGTISAKGYRAYRFKPVTILHGKRGADFHDYLTAARTAHYNITRGAQAAMQDVLSQGLRSYGVPPGAHKDGIRYVTIGDIFRKEVDKILLKEAPAFAYGHDAKGEPAE